MKALCRALAIAQNMGCAEASVGPILQLRDMAVASAMKDGVLKAHKVSSWDELNLREGDLMGGFVFTHAEPLKKPLLHPAWELEAKGRYGLAGIAFFQLLPGSHWNKSSWIGQRDGAKPYSPQPMWKVTNPRDLVEKIGPLLCDFMVLDGPETFSRSHPRCLVKGVSIQAVCDRLRGVYDITYASGVGLPDDVFSLHPAMASSLAKGKKRREMRPVAVCLRMAPIDQTRRGQYDQISARRARAPDKGRASGMRQGPQRDPDPSEESS